MIMDILGFSIMRKSKRIKEIQQLTTFRQSVYGINETVDLFRKALRSFNFSFDTFAEYSMLQNTLESFINVYLDSPFATPSTAFKMDEVIPKCKSTLYQLGLIVTKKQKWDEHKDVITEAFNGDDFVSKAIRDGMKSSKQDMINNASSLLRTYNELLRAIEFTIKYDVVRVTCDADILEQYHRNKKLKKVPETEFIISFKRLSKEEIDLQKEDEENEHT
jgi:hypothetical protein